MNDQQTHNDKPISEPAEDRFGIDPFARALASSIRNLASPEGTVVALNGPWGSGKSSAVNLILYHLKDSIDAQQLVAVNFACWWFRGEEKLALAFFRELYSGLGPTLGKRFRKALPKLGARLLKAGSVVGPGIDLAGGAGAGTVVSGAMNWVAGLVRPADSVEKLHAELAATLAEQKKRFLIVIDDIDRLAPDEALLIFRLVKSVGRLPNVVYLLVFDRKLAEAIVTERYPAEGPHYLEKIIQAGFDIPEPRRDDLRKQLLEQVGAICGSPSSDDMVRFMNVFYDVVAPEIRTPRDLIRLANGLAVTWPAVGAEVDRADFVGLEVLRLLRPNVYRAVRANKDRLIGASESAARRSQQEQRSEYDELMLDTTDPRDQERLRRGLMRLFPRLESIWSNLHYSDSSEWSRQRRVCGADHFDSYFRFSIGDDILSRSEIDLLIANAADQAFTIRSLREALAVGRSGGGTKAALILDEMNLHAERVADETVEPLLAALFKLGDELDVPADAAKGFSIGDNHLRIHWLLRRLTLDRFELAARSAIFVAACESAAFAWLVDFSDSAYCDYHPRNGEVPEPESKCLTTADDAESLRVKALERIRTASKSKELATNPRLPYLLYRWRDMAVDEGVEVKGWCEARLAQDDMIVTFARAFTSHGWSQSVADTVARRTTIANVNGLESILNKELFRTRVEELSASEALSELDTQILSEFLEAWKQHDNNPRR